MTRHAPALVHAPGRVASRPPVRARIVTLALVVLAVACRRDAAPDASLAELEATARRFYLGMATDDGDENRRAMRDVAPTAADFAVLFPRHHDDLWKVWSPEVDALVTHAPEHAPSYREVMPIRSIRTVDLRREGSDALKRGLGHLPEDVPVRGVAIEIVKGERAAAAFVFVRGRWVWIWDLERLDRLLPAPGEG
ncbi:MAG: hypothetical protein IT294_12180 [Deltaproteobacteria bacterium]|nr:hypothetical protein [Deltaproteobacteria bacterium]